MTTRIANRRRFMVEATVLLLILAAFRTPAVRGVILSGLVEFAQVTERIVRIPCCLFDHTHCFSLDRLDPTCPQCL